MPLPRTSTSKFRGFANVVVLVPLNEVSVGTDGEEMEALQDFIGEVAGATSHRRGIPVGTHWLIALARCLAGPAAADLPGPIYQFTDERGVTHFSNVTPVDPRFRPRKPAPPRPRRDRAPARADYDGLIGEVAAQHSLPPALLKAVIAAESGFDPRALSRVGAQGLMQLMPETADALGVEDPWVPEQNVRGGGGYLRALLDRYGDLTRALAAYNAGPEAVDRYGGLPPYRETRAYVERVLTYYRSYHGDFAR